MRDFGGLVAAADPGDLLLAVDGLVADRDWDGLAELAHRCRDAVELGRQLWPVATHIDYRLAWEAPASYAGGVLRPGAGRFALGPLTEVAASTHAWDDLAPFLSDPATAAGVAQERVLRGEDLRGRVAASGWPALEEEGAELPLVLVAWEPAYGLPRYRDRSAAFPQPEVAARTLPEPRPLRPTSPLQADEVVPALLAVVESWTVESAGTATALVVEGGVTEAVAGFAGEASLLDITGTEALAMLQWCGASGGAYGRRPGGARGRFSAWWAVTALAGLSWPPDPEELGEAVEELQWCRWSRPGAEAGWVLRLAVADPVDGLAWAVEGLDAREEDTPG